MRNIRQNRVNLPGIHYLDGTTAPLANYGKVRGIIKEFQTHPGKTDSWLPM